MIQCFFYSFEDKTFVPRQTAGIVNFSIHDVNKCRSSLEILKVDVVEDPGVDDHVVLDVVVRHRDAAVAHLPLGHGHPVVVHLLLRELVVGVQGLGRLSQHQLHLAQSSPPDASISCLSSLILGENSARDR